MVQLNEPSKLSVLMSWVIDIIVVLSLAGYTVYSFGARVTITGHSMEPVLNAEDVVLMNRLSYDLSSPKRLDAAVIDRGAMGYSVKRIIGLPGETVQISNNSVYIDGEKLEGIEPVMVPGIAAEPLKLAEDEYFLLGDNRNSSEDSRFISVGMITREEIIGKVWLRISPVSDFGSVH